MCISSVSRHGTPSTVLASHISPIFLLSHHHYFYQIDCRRQRQQIEKWKYYCSCWETNCPCCFLDDPQFWEEPLPSGQGHCHCDCHHCHFRHCPTLRTLMVHWCRCRVKNWALSRLSSLSSQLHPRSPFWSRFHRLFHWSVPRRLKTVHSCRFSESIRIESALSRCFGMFSTIFRFSSSPLSPLKWFTRFRNRAPKSHPFVHFHRIHLKQLEDLEILPYLVYPCAIQSYLIASDCPFYMFFLFFFLFFVFSIIFTFSISWWIYKISSKIRWRMGAKRSGVDPCRVKILIESVCFKKGAVFVVIFV